MAVMKKVKMLIPYKTIVMFALFYSNTSIANGPSIPPPPPGFAPYPASDTDLFMIPMVIIGIICIFFLGIALEFLFIRKNNRVY
jgi:hypothetical protein